MKKEYNLNIKYDDSGDNCEIDEYFDKEELIFTVDDKDIICPSGTYLDYVHLTMNQMSAQKEPYHYQIMTQFGFKKDDSGDYWIRNKESQTGLNWIGLWT